MVALAFTTVNVCEGWLAYTNSAESKDIFTRVIGRDPSNILGKFDVFSNANLCSLNPNNIVFGLNFQLAITGCFVPSTASCVFFADGIQFNAIAPQATSLLILNTPHWLTIRDISLS